MAFTFFVRADELDLRSEFVSDESDEALEGFVLPPRT